MAQVMDPTQASGQIQLLTELRTRFPEVPVDIIGVIMQQVSCGQQLLCLSVFQWIFNTKCAIVATFCDAVV